MNVIKDFIDVLGLNPQNFGYSIAVNQHHVNTVRVRNDTTIIIPLQINKKKNTYKEQIAKELVISIISKKASDRAKKLLTALYPNQKILSHGEYCIFYGDHDYIEVFKPNNFCVYSVSKREFPMKQVGKILLDEGIITLEKISSISNGYDDSLGITPRGILSIPKSVNNKYLVQRVNIIERTSTKVVVELAAARVINTEFDIKNVLNGTRLEKHTIPRNDIKKISKRMIASLINNHLTITEEQIPEPEWLKKIDSIYDVISNPYEDNTYKLTNSDPIYEGDRLFIDCFNVLHVKIGEIWVAIHTEYLPSLKDEDLMTEYQMYKNLIKI